MVTAYTPDRGDLVYLSFDPQLGHEQAGLRPAVVLSPRAYNAKSGLALFCPITRQAKGYPFEVLLVQSGLEGVVLADQIKSFDYRIRKPRFIEKISDHAMEEVLGKLSVLLE